MELHKEVGPAATTVSEIARRAGVARLTVYNHFPESRDLLGACQAHWMTLHPLPDLAAALGLADPKQRVRAVLREQYRWYRETMPMAELIQRDRGAVPELDDLMTQTGDVRFARLTHSLMEGFSSSGHEARRRRALVRLSLDVWCWRRLQRESLSDDEAADVMAAAVACC